MNDEMTCDLYRVPESDGGRRLDLFLAARNPDLSRSQIKRAAEEGRVMVNHASAKAGLCLKPGDIVLLEREPPRAWNVEAEDIPLSVLFEDESIIVIDKPPGIVVHPGAGNIRGTLVNALLHHCRDLSGIGGVLRPGVVHRLDKDTSGVMVVAKTDAAHQALAAQFKARAVMKRYSAVVVGSMPAEEGIIDAPIGRHRRDRKKMTTGVKEGREAVTKWKVVKDYGGVASLLDVEIETGRTHQIRVHLNSVKRPVLGDREYGGLATSLPERIRKGPAGEALKAMNRQALHAAALGFHHPQSGRYLEFTAPLPEDMARLIGELESLSRSAGGR